MFGRSRLGDQSHGHGDRPRRSRRRWVVSGLGGTSAPAMVGRSHELAAVSALLERARHGSGAGIVVRGEPGVGKVRCCSPPPWLPRTASPCSRRRECQSESDLAFGALAALLRPLLEGINALPAVQADALRAAVGLSSAVHVEQITCFAAVVSLLAAAARTRPLIVVVDDLQWCDQGSTRRGLFCRPPVAVGSSCVRVRSEGRRDS